MSRALSILVATLLIGLVTMGLRKTLFSPPSAEVVCEQITDYSVTQGWAWESHSGFGSSGISGRPTDSVASKAMHAVIGRTGETGFDEFEFSDGSGLIVVRVEHADDHVKQVDISGTGVASGTTENLRRHLKAQPGWFRCRILSP